MSRWPLDCIFGIGFNQWIVQLRNKLGRSALKGYAYYAKNVITFATAVYHCRLALRYILSTTTVFSFVLFSKDKDITNWKCFLKSDIGRPRKDKTRGNAKIQFQLLLVRATEGKIATEVDHLPFRPKFKWCSLHKWLCHDRHAVIKGIPVPVYLPCACCLVFHGVESENSVYIFSAFKHSTLQFSTSTRNTPINVWLQSVCNTGAQLNGYP